MKLFIFLLLFLLVTANAWAQDSWKVVHNKKIKLQTATEDENKNIVTISRSDLKKDDYLLLTYAAKENKNWKRSMLLFDENDRELLTQEGNQLRVKNAKLLAFASNVKNLMIYTLSLPADPAVAATVRVRRMHLCTIQLKE